ncbi:MAG: GGDEF domain-containing protein [Acidobacteria bacterium]|nr:GGDEF domain-containing protein [Acidobacteriota bacterium]
MAFGRAWGYTPPLYELLSGAGTMDTTTLVLANGLLFALYAGVMLVNARIVGGTRGAMWFAGANLLRGASMLLVGVEWMDLTPARYAAAISAMFAVVGALMLHQAFADLLERGELMRGVQVALVVAMAAGSTLMILFPSLEFLLGVMLCGVLSLQFAVIALLVFRFSGEGVGPAGWLTGLALLFYAFMLMLRAVLSTKFGIKTLNISAPIIPVWLMACIVTSAATAFGFMSLSTAKLRVELLWRAQVDELTGLLNRWALKRMVMREIERCRRRKSSLAVIMIDLDGLKRVNDTTGHSSGDVMLQAVAGVLHEAVREQDSVARMGGDEFCVLLSETSLDEAIIVAERLREEIQGLIVNYRGETVRTGASLGVASSDVCGLGWQLLMDSSDSALYRAKRDGRNRVVAAKKESAAEISTQVERASFIGERSKLAN